MSCEKRIDRAISKGTTLLLGKCSRYAVFSDCHRGCGNMSDNFLRNQHLYFAALEHYYMEGFYYLEPGDGEELWENRSLRRIQDSHRNVYEQFECFKRRKRFCKICEEVNRYSGSEPREKESDILELVDQFGGMLLDRPERIAFKVDEALVLLEYRNLKDKYNYYLEHFKEFIIEMQEVLV